MSFCWAAKTRNAHWNTEGGDFFEKHKFFETQYRELDELVDQLAERIRVTGHYAIASLKSYLEQTHLTEATRENNDGTGFVKLLLADHEAIIIRLRKNIDHVTNELKDAGAGDFMTGLMAAHEKMAWMLRVQLKH